VPCRPESTGRRAPRPFHLSTGAGAATAAQSGIATMREAGRDMKDKYKETARGGLAVSIVEC
jgi:hypothetical protein